MARGNALEGGEPFGRRGSLKPLSSRLTPPWLSVAYAKRDVGLNGGFRSVDVLEFFRSFQVKLKHLRVLQDSEIVELRVIEEQPFSCIVPRPIFTGQFPTIDLWGGLTPI